MLNKKVSLICPIYNEEKHILNCIESILMQDYPLDLIEFLLIDGLSKDRTREIINEYVVKYPFIHLLDNNKKNHPKKGNTNWLALPITPLLSAT